MIVARILFHMATIAVVLNLVDRLLAQEYVPLAHFLLDWLRPAYYLLFALTVACLLNRRPALLVTVLAITVLLTFQAIKEDLITPATPVLLGILTARLVQAVTPDPEEDV